VYWIVVCDDDNKLEQIYSAHDDVTATDPILFMFIPIILILPNSNFPLFNSTLVITSVSRADTHIHMLI